MYHSFIKVKLSLGYLGYCVNSLSRLEIPLTSEIAERIDEAVEFLDYGSREELVLCVIRRFLDRYQIPEIKAR